MCWTGPSSATCCRAWIPTFAALLHSAHQDPRSPRHCLSQTESIPNLNPEVLIALIAPGCWQRSTSDRTAFCLSVSFQGGLRGCVFNSTYAAAPGTDALLKELRSRFFGAGDDKPPGIDKGAVPVKLEAGFRV